jgi:hypothetical protein
MPRPTCRSCHTQFWGWLPSRRCAKCRNPPRASRACHSNSRKLLARGCTTMRPGSTGRRLTREAKWPNLIDVRGCEACGRSAIAPYGRLPLPARQFAHWPHAWSIRMARQWARYRRHGPYHDGALFDISCDQTIWEYVVDDGRGHPALLRHRRLAGSALWLRAGPIGVEEADRATGMMRARAMVNRHRRHMAGPSHGL